MKVLGTFPVPDDFSPKTQNEERILNDFHPMMRFLFEKYNKAQRDDVDNNLCLPDSKDEILAKFDIVIPKCFQTEQGEFIFFCPTRPRRPNMRSLFSHMVSVRPSENQNTRTAKTKHLTTLNGVWWVT